IFSSPPRSLTVTKAETSSPRLFAPSELAPSRLSRMLVCPAAMSDSAASARGTLLRPNRSLILNWASASRIVTLPTRLSLKPSSFKFGSPITQTKVPGINDAPPIISCWLQLIWRIPEELRTELAKLYLLTTKLHAQAIYVKHEIYFAH